MNSRVRCAAAMAALTVIAPVMVAVTAGSADAAVKTCKVGTFHTKISNVHKSHKDVVTHATVRVLPGKTIYRKGSTHWAAHRTTLRAGASVKGEVGLSVGAVLKKIIHIGLSTKESAALRGSVGHTSSKRSKIVTDTKTVIPHATSIVWFRGARYYTGTFDYTACAYTDGKRNAPGIVVKRHGKWSSYGYSEYGGQPCDRPAYSHVATAAKKRYC